MSSTWPTPATDSSWRRRVLSVNSVTSRMGRGAETATDSTGAASGSIFSITGGSASRGRSRSTLLTRSRTSWAATSGFFSSSKLMMTCETPSEEIEMSWSMPLMVLTASSILSVTSVSISSGAAPARRVEMVTKGRSILGKRSTPRRP